VVGLVTGNEIIVECNFPSHELWKEDNTNCSCIAINIFIVKYIRSQVIAISICDCMDRLTSLLAQTVRLAVGI